MLEGLGSSPEKPPEGVGLGLWVKAKHTPPQACSLSAVSPHNHPTWNPQEHHTKTKKSQFISQQGPPSGTGGSNSSATLLRQTPGPEGDVAGAGSQGLQTPAPLRPRGSACWVLGLPPYQARGLPGRLACPAYPLFCD